jgi:predicted ATPase
MPASAYEVCEELVRRPSFILSSGYRRSDRRPVLLRAFEELIDQLLAESEESQQEWKRLILTAVRPNAGVIAEAVPRVRYLIGEQESPLPLDPAERQNRFPLRRRSRGNLYHL